MFKKLSFTLLGIVLVYAAVAFAMKAGIGVLPVVVADTLLTLGGTILNFFLYTVLAGVSFTFYPVRLIVSIVAFLVIISIVLTLIFGTDWTLREGTIIAALIFGPAMDFWKKTVFAKKRM